MATAPEAPAPPSVEVPVIEPSIEPRRSGRIRNQIQRFEDEVLLLDNDEPTTYKEAMMGPDSVKWLECHEIRDRIHVRESSLELGGPS